MPRLVQRMSRRFSARVDKYHKNLKEAMAEMQLFKENPAVIMDPKALRSWIRRRVTFLREAQDNGWKITQTGQKDITDFVDSICYALGVSNDGKGKMSM